jgi:transcriptional activator SPT7
MTVRILKQPNAAQTLSVVIKKPMDLWTMSKNVKAHKYKNKAEFQADLDQIWENCFIYNTEASGLDLVTSCYLYTGPPPPKFGSIPEAKGGSSLGIPGRSKRARRLSFFPSTSF